MLGLTAVAAAMQGLCCHHSQNSVRAINHTKFAMMLQQCGLPGQQHKELNADCGNTSLLCLALCDFWLVALCLYGPCWPPVLTLLCLCCPHKAPRASPSASTWR